MEIEYKTRIQLKIEDAVTNGGGYLRIPRQWFSSESRALRVWLKERKWWEESGHKKITPNHVPDEISYWRFRRWRTKCGAYKFISELLINYGAVLNQYLLQLDKLKRLTGLEGKIATN
jgi:hypothetical protein